MFCFQKMLFWRKKGNNVTKNAVAKYNVLLSRRQRLNRLKLKVLPDVSMSQLLLTLNYGQKGLTKECKRPLTSEWVMSQMPKLTFLLTSML